MNKHACLFAALVLTFSLSVWAQSPAPAVSPSTASPAAPAADPTHGIVFDVVSIRPVEERHNGHIDNPLDGDGIVIENSLPIEIVRWNFNMSSLRENQLQGAPKWFTTQNYDIRAKVAESDIAAWKALGEGGHRLVFRKMLQDRFHFAWHFADVDAPVYNLVIAKGGLKIKEAKPGEVSPYAFRVDGLPYKGTGITIRPSPAGGPMWVMQQAHMSSFAKNFLSEQVGRQVIDKTGLTGAYNFSLDFAQEALAPTSPEAGASEPAKAGLFTALQEQLGLKLEPARGPVSMMYIDHIDPPSEN